jgi:1-acyl-sn-glycerol-3-phosphate acyltransferase
MGTRQWWWWPYQLWKLLVVFPAVAVATTVGAAIILVLIPFVDANALSRVVAGGWARLLARVIPMPVRVEGRRHVDPQQSYVVVSNHSSHVDILVLYGWLGIDFRWVMKQELRSVPALGVACDRLGHIYIDRSDHEAAVASINAARDRIVGGTSVVFFPEGTRSDDGQLRSFKKGAFRFAVDAGLPILPVTVVGAAAVMPARSLDLRPGRVGLVIHPPVATDGVTALTLPALIERVRSAVASALGENSGPSPE